MAKSQYIMGKWAYISSPNIW